MTTLTQPNGFERYLLALRLLFSSILCASAAFFIYKSLHWQVMWDTSIMHYVNFLMAHGMAPYRDIIDINMPGSYFIEGWAMHIFGGGDLGWRLYEFFLSALLTASLIVIAFPYDWFAGLYAGIIFLLLHGAEGPVFAVERDEVMGTLVVLSYAFLFTALRKQKPLLMLPFGVAIGLAASIKPTVAPLGLVLLLVMFFALKKEKGNNDGPKLYLTLGLLGMLIAFLFDVEFLYRYHAFNAFFALNKRLTVYYTQIGNNTFLVVIRPMLLRKYYVPILFGIVLTVLNRAKKRWENWERLMLVLGIAFAAASYLAQHKAIPYHIYPFQMFVLLWSSLEMVKAIRIRGWLHALGLAGIALGMVSIVLPATQRIATSDPLNEPPDTLKMDLIRLGGSSLQHQVQCLAMVDACYSTLYKLQLLPNTGLIGDYMLLQPPGEPPLPYYRDIFWNDLRRNPPKVIILSDQWFGHSNSFAKLDQWPQLAAYVNSTYTLDVTRTFKYSAYRIYVLKNHR